jgi:hypothetical protein
VFDDKLAVPLPVPADRSLGRGKDRALALGGAAGTRTLLIAANPGQVNLVSPAEIGPALKAGYARAVKEADRVKAFWA